MRLASWVWLAIAFVCCNASAGDGSGNRLTYLDSPVDPYYVDLHTARLITPQWVGDEGVEAVIVLAIDDMSDPAKYEQFLRPIFSRLKSIDGRAPVSIMTKHVDPAAPELKMWAQEGISIEAHTQDHPCPCLQAGSLGNAKATYDRCVDQLNTLTATEPVAFRMPCCDSMNSVSPRFFAEVFDKTTPEGHFLAIDTSVFMLFTREDTALPRDLVRDHDRREKFRKYIPTDRIMSNYIENYPYPYVIGHRCWEIPSLMPSDWVAQHLHGKCNSDTVRDFKAAIDATLIKQGVFALCFHPHGWIRNDQIVELIDYADTQYGRKVKFLTFPEVQQRLDDHLLGGRTLRATSGGDNGVRIADLDADGLMDVIIANPTCRETRVWHSADSQWHTTEFPVALVNDQSQPGSEETGVRFGVLQANGHASIVVRNDQLAGLWHFDGATWQADSSGLQGLISDGLVHTQVHGRDSGVRLRDLDLDGCCELIVGNDRQDAVFAYSRPGWKRLPFSLPENVAIVDRQGRDAGLRFVDFDEDGHDDVVFSNASHYSAHIFHSVRDGWARTTLHGVSGDKHALPLITRADFTNNGVWFKYGYMWAQNEDTGGKLPDHVIRLPFDALSTTTSD